MFCATVQCCRCGLFISEQQSDRKLIMCTIKVQYVCVCFWESRPFHVLCSYKTQKICYFRLCGEQLEIQFP